MRKLVPKLRFDGFSGEWDKKPINEILTIGSGRDYKHLDNGNIPVYGTGGYMLSVNDYLYDGESVCIGRKGTIDKPVFLTGKFWTVDTLFYTHSFKKNIPKFIYSLFQKINWYKYNEASGVPSLSKVTIGKINIFIPKPPEQQKIANCLSSLDALIEVQNKKVEALKKHKKGLMQGLFPKDGEKVPELRFDGFFGEWEEKSIDTLFNYKNGGSFEKQIIENGKYNLITLNSIDINGELKKQHKTINLKSDFLKINDLIMVLSDVAHGDFLGLTALIPCDNKYILNQRMGLLRLKTNDNIFFIRLFINLNQKYFKLHGHGSSQQNLSKGDILKFAIKIPKDLKEQQKIANTLSSIDALIEEQNNKIEALKKHKKGLMQGLFVNNEGQI